MFSEIIFNSERYAGYTVVGSNQNNHLDKISRVNIFIGPNNSGKSRFVRTLFADDDFDFLLSKVDSKTLQATIRKSHNQVKTIFDNNFFTDIDGFLQKIKAIEEKFSYFKKTNLNTNVQELRYFLSEFCNKEKFSGADRHPNMISSRDPNALLPIVKQECLRLRDCLDEIFPSESEMEIQRIYIPMLRGLRPTAPHDPFNEQFRFHQNADNYKQRTLKDYFFDDKEKLKKEIFTGLNLYEDTKRFLLGRKNERDKIKEFERFLSETFFSNQAVSLIPDIDNDVLLIGIGQDERPVHQLGDGIQSIIIMLYPLFFNQGKNLLVFIEEPETSLHPGMQRIFLEALQRKEFDKFQYFITTHSNHFLDITLDFKNISVYSLRRNSGANVPSIEIENVSNEDTVLLDLIGVKNASIFLSNCTIWVEGITDRFYLRKYLEVYQSKLFKEGILDKKFREDLHFSFLEYGGSNITHYAFSDDDVFGKIRSNRITNRIMLIADSDNSSIDTKSAKAERLKKLKQNLNDRFIQIDGKEIENLLNENVLLQALCKIEKKKLDDFHYDPSAVRQKNYKNLGLGLFIAENIKGLRKTYKAPSGTIKNKMAFCHAAIDCILSFEDLSAPAQKLTKKIFDFISANNS